MHPDGLRFIAVMTLVIASGILIYWYFCTISGEIYMLKRRARKIIKEMRRMSESADCGHAMMMNISVHYSDLYNELEVIKERCRQIDPKAPKNL